MHVPDAWKTLEEKLLSLPDRVGSAATLEELKNAASTLPVADRAELARFLLGSLDEHEAADARAEWLSLAERRMAEVKAGKVVGIPAEEVLRTLPGSPRWQTISARL